MENLLAIAGGAVINALAFSGTNYAFHKLSSGDEERKRHDLAMERFQRAQNLWIKNRQNGIHAKQKRRRAAQKAEDNFQELDMSMSSMQRRGKRKIPSPSSINITTLGNHKRKTTTCLHWQVLVLSEPLLITFCKSQNADKNRVLYKLHQADSYNFHAYFAGRDPTRYFCSCDVFYVHPENAVRLQTPVFYLSKCTLTNSFPFSFHTFQNRTMI